VAETAQGGVGKVRKITINIPFNILHDLRPVQIRYECTRMWLGGVIVTASD